METDYNFALSDLSQPEGSRLDLRSFGNDFFGWQTRKHSTPLEIQLLQSYKKTEGDAQLISSISGFLQEESEFLMVTDSGSQALTLAILHAVQRKRKIGIPRPYFPGFLALAEAFGAEVFFYEMQDASSAIDIIKRENIQNVSLLMNTPNNPLGITISDTFRRKILDFQSEYGMEILSDNSYYWMENKDCRSNFGNIRIYSIGKALGLPGLRLGALAVESPKVLDDLINLKRHIALHSCPLSQKLVGDLIEEFDFSILHKSWRYKISERVSFLVEHPHLLGPQINSPIVGPFTMIENCTKTQSKVLGVPGHVFGARRDQIRICLAADDLIWQHFVLLQQFREA